MNTADTATDRIWSGLTPDQADGSSCVICGATHVHGQPHSPVGWSTTGCQVFACWQLCWQAATKSRPDEDVLR